MVGKRYGRHRLCSVTLVPIPPRGNYGLVTRGRQVYAVYDSGKVWGLASASWLPAFITGRRGTRSVCIDGKPIALHRLVLLSFVGPPPTRGPIGRHLDDNQENNNLKNLSWGTHIDNMRDRDTNYRTAKGEKNGGGRKLTNDKVKLIKQDMTSKLRVLAKLYGVSTTVISNIRRGVDWKHI